MNKLFILGQGDSVYAAELQLAYEILSNQATPLKIKLADLNVEFLLQNAVEVVIANGLPKQWFYILKGLNIVSIIFDNINEYHDLADIVIDCRSTDNHKYFTGEKCSLLNKSHLNIQEVTDLVYKMEWDSKFFEFPVAYLSCRYLSENIIYQTDKFIKKNKVKLLEYLCNCHDDRSVQIAEKNNFHFTDIRITFDLKLGAHYQIKDTSLSFGLADNHHIEPLKSLTKDMYKDSRYFYDGNFSLDKINVFYSGWIEKAVIGTFDHECYCLFDHEQPIGFCSIRYESEDAVSIGLFGMDNAYSGRGLGKTLLYKVCNRMIEKGIKTISVVTQGRNYAAQRLYQSVGFRTSSTQLWYHKWL